MFAAKNELFTTPSGYQIQRSLRFRSSASAYLSRTVGTASNRKTFTYSAWIKRGDLTIANRILIQPNVSFEAIYFDNATNALRVQSITGTTYDLRTTQLFRDPSAWYHIVVAFDTTQATSTNRIKIYVNGLQVTAFDISTYPTQNGDTAYNSAIAQYIGGTQYFDGYMTEINWIDGQALTPSSFGATNATTGVWSATKYAGTYGTNGFYLNFTDNSAATAATIGKDFSGNGNNWTPNNISVTAGATYDSMLDAPLGAGGGERGNYAVLNPISNPNGPIYTISAGNLDYSCSASGGNAPKMSVLGSILMQGSGKYYCEATETSLNSNFGLTSGLVAGGTAIGVNYAIVYNGGTSASAATYSGTTPTFVSSDLIGLAFDVGALTLAIYKNGTLLGTLSGLESTVNGWLFLQTVNTGAFSTSAVWNFGQRPFSYTPPTGFKALHTGNLGAPVIALPAQNMAATLYTGNSSTQVISNAVNGVSFQPDWVWYKDRSNARDHGLFDSVRGVTNYLASNLTSAASTVSGVTAFNSDGFTLGGSINSNNSGETYVGWQWKAGGTAVSNTSGSITSSVSANTTAGFSVVTYTGTGANATVGHGLGVAPSMIIVKRRDAGGSEWGIYHISTGNTSYLLFTTGASVVNSTFWQNTSPTSTVFSIGTNGTPNPSAGTIVAYCFAPVAGYSAFGSYTGNGSADGPFVFTGFRPRFIMWKRTDTTSGWSMHDTSRDPYNISTNNLFADSSGAEDTGDSIIDLLSNGFKLRNTYARANASGGTYIYMAFAESPFRNSLAR